MNATRFLSLNDVRLFGLLFVLVIFRVTFSAAHAEPEPLKDVSHLLITAPLDVDPAGSVPDRLPPHPWQIAVLFAAPMLYALLYLVCRCKRHRIALLLAFLYTTSAHAATLNENRFLWDQANVQMTLARAPNDFLLPVQSYQQLIANGVRNGHVFYNLGTALLKADRPRRALAALEQAEQYSGARADIRHNMAVARHRLRADSFGGTSAWQRALLFWNLPLSIQARTTIAVGAYVAVWFALSLRLFGMTRLSKPCFVGALVLLVVFGSSAAASLLSELATQTGRTRGLHPVHRDDEASSFLPELTPGDADTTSQRAQNLPPRNTAPPPRAHSTVDPDSSMQPHPLAPVNENLPVTARLAVNPVAPYRFQAFTLTLTIQASRLRLGQTLKLEGLPPSDVLRREPFKELPPTRSSVDGKVIEIRRYRCMARVLTPRLPILHPDLMVSVIGSESDAAHVDNEAIHHIALAPLDLTVRPLPARNRPTDFSGAVGRFTFAANVQPGPVIPGYPIHMEMRIVGEGYTDGMTSIGVRHAPGCRLRAPRSQPSSDARQIVYEQRIIPQSTNVTHIPAVAFSYFDPIRERYERPTQGPFELHFAAAPRLARFAPSPLAMVLFELAPDETPTVLETEGDWIKVRAKRRIGWIHRDPVRLPGR